VRLTGLARGPKATVRAHERIDHMPPQEIAAIKIAPNRTRRPPGKVASAEIEFFGGVLDGLRLVGFGIWTKQGGGHNVTLPARQYIVDSKPRTFALLQPQTDEGASLRLRALILEAFRNQQGDSEDDEIPDLPRP